jgi:2',3'-cyclic-nucleotide 2'-phosphodiesterase
MSVCQAFYLLHIHSYLTCSVNWFWQLIGMRALGNRSKTGDHRGLRILFIGDIVGRPGRELVRQGLGALVDYHSVDLVIANAENAAAGFGITREIGEQILDWGVDVMTSGNHIWDKKEALDYIGTESRLLRPANYPAGAPGNGGYLARTKNGQTVGVINVMGRVFMPLLDDPFAIVLKEIEALKARARIIFVDFHAEATSEKIAMGWHLDGRVTAVVGTHTHVQTADERILPKGTAYLTDVGMTGPHDSVIGVEIQAALGKFINGLPARFDTATENPRLNAVVIDADEQTGRATDIERLSYGLEELKDLGIGSVRSTV